MTTRWVQGRPDTFTKNHGRLLGPCQEVGTLSHCTTSSCYGLCCRRWPWLWAVERVRNHRSEAWMAPVSLPGNTETPLFRIPVRSSAKGRNYGQNSTALWLIFSECLLAS